MIQAGLTDWLSTLILTKPMHTVSGDAGHNLRMTLQTPRLLCVFLFALFSCNVARNTMV